MFGRIDEISSAVHSLRFRTRTSSITKEVLQAYHILSLGYPPLPAFALPVSSTPHQRTLGSALHYLYLHLRQQIKHLPFFAPHRQLFYEMPFPHISYELISLRTHITQPLLQLQQGLYKIQSRQSVMSYSQEKPDTLQAVETILAYHFTDRNQLWTALQAAGSSYPGERTDTDGNKRLAILGDAVLKLALVEDWYHTGHVKRKRRLTITKKSLILSPN